MRVYRDDQKAMNLRISLLMWGVVGTFLFLAVSFWWVQGVHADKFRTLSESNALREVPIRAKRGLIMDRNGKILADNQASYSLMLNRSDLRKLNKLDPTHRTRMLQFISTVLDIPVAEIEKRIEVQKLKGIRMTQPIPLGEDLSISQVAEIESSKLTYPAIAIEVVQRRNYLYDTLAGHVLGYMSEADEEDRKKNAQLKLGDLIGKKGIELVYDDFLRGRDGAKYMIVDSHGRSRSEYQRLRRDPVAGRNIYLTLDFELQRRAEQYFVDNEMVGAAVAMDPRNGEILAMVSSPGYDPNVFSRRFTPETWKTINSNPFKLLNNRAIQGLYSPGSVFKIVMGMAGLEHGVVNPSTTFHCTGSGAFSGRRFRCWKKEGHGDVDLERALKVSCDIYFYNVGQRLGIDKIAKYANQLTFGQSVKIDLEGEKVGLVPSIQWAREKQNRKWYPSETISVAIGQGPLIVTVLQTATMTASVANGGNLFRPHLLRVLEDYGPNGSIVKKRVKSEVLSKVNLPASALQSVRNGLWQVVNQEGGTGGNARIEGLDISGKTGTVQVINQTTWIKAEHLPFKFRDHAWFASFAPLKNPELVVVVFVEHGGHGGSDAAPLAKQMYEARFKGQFKAAMLNLSDPETLEKIKDGELRVTPPGVMNR